MNSTQYYHSTVILALRMEYYHTHYTHKMRRKYTIIGRTGIMLSPVYLSEHQHRIRRLLLQYTITNGLY